jgi:ATP-binding cassette subfamily B protein
MKAQLKYTMFQLIKKIIIQARPYWLSIIVFFLLTLLATPIALMKPVAMKIVIDSGFGSSPLPGFLTMWFPDTFLYSFDAVIIIAIAVMVLVAIIDNINGYLIWLLTTYAGEKLVLNFRLLLFDHIQRLSIAYHDRLGASDSLYRIQWDTMSIRALLLGQVTSLLSSLFTLISMVFVMFSINGTFALIALSIIPPLFILTHVRAKRLRKDWSKVKTAESNVMAVIHEVMGSLRVVKAFGQEESENRRFLSESNLAVDKQMAMARLGASFQFIVSLLFTLGSVLIIYFGAHFVKSGQITLGSLTIVLAYVGQIFGPLQSMSKNITDLQASIASVDRVFAVMDEEKEVSEHPDAKPLKHVTGAISFQNVCFSYETDTPILDNVSFEIRSGDRVGIMGTTGAGKSTLVNLINRFYDPSSGKVLIDGEDIKKFKLKDYRKQFSMVLQDPILFSTTIAENIRYGKPDATDEEVIEASIMANAHNFIIKSKDGYDTMVGERGMKLSGGERQRISIARAFIKNAPILILDEPTSSLDVVTEGLIMDAMERLMKDRTTFMITHRLDTLSACNIILQLEKGKLVDLVRDFDKDFLANKKTDYFNKGREKVTIVPKT